MGRVIESDIQVRFADADCLGHVNNINLHHYFDVGKMQFYAQVLGKTIDPDSESLILASTHANYYHQTKLHEKLYVETAVEKIGNKSVTIYQRLMERTTGRVNADCRTVAVGFDFETQETFPLKPAWVERMQEYLITAE